MTRFLVLSPHPDDEVVGCAAAIRRALAAGDHGFVLHLTTGLPAAGTLWPWQRRCHRARTARRRAEAECAAAALGVVPLGFQDWPSRTLKHHLDEALALIHGLITGQGIDALWVPAWEGAHQDHDVANFIGARFANALPVIEFAEYNFAGARVRANEFPFTDGTERHLFLSAAERRWKADLLAVYRSERANLAHCRVTQETLRPLAAYDYARPPHPGLLFRERFHWVPLNHPRIDFEPSSAVRIALEHSYRLSSLPTDAAPRRPRIGISEPSSGLR